MAKAKLHNDDWNFKTRQKGHSFDPALDKLFEQSLGPVKLVTTCPARLGGSEQPPDRTEEESEFESADKDQQSASLLGEPRPKVVSDSLAKSTRKRKRDKEDSNLEGRHLDRLAQEEAREEEHRSLEHHKKRFMSGSPKDSLDIDVSSGSVQEDVTFGVSLVAEHDEDLAQDPPQHESIVTSKPDLDLEKSSRTVFLANVSTSAIKSKSAKKELLNHLASFIPSLPELDAKHGIESFRFRSTAFASGGIPRKAAFARKDLMDTTTKSTNAYVVYTTQLASREAVKRLNGSVILDRHLRVDSVAHPAKIDHRKCVFVGNLGFVDDATNINAAEDEDNAKRPRKAKEPADVEEGLWRQFGKAGRVESVRVVRDKTTRVGKGFAYVQFENENAVEKALLFNEKKFPPRLPRILRVTRAKNIKKATGHKGAKATSKQNLSSTTSYNAKVPATVQSLSGRAGKLLGRAGAAQLRVAGDKRNSSNKTTNIAKSPESIVFEGYRASRQQGKLGKVVKGQPSKPKNRSSRRGADFKAKGKKKARI